ncbi:MAG: histone deacetylase [Pseudomonadota bacterium]
MAEGEPRRAQLVPRPLSSWQILLSYLVILTVTSAIQAQTKTGLVFHKDYLAHDTGRNHPENADRLRAVVQHLKETGIADSVHSIDARLVADKWITMVHHPDYWRALKRASEKAPLMLDQDTVMSAGSLTAARRASGGILAAIDAVVSQTVQTAFVAARPPGHHALSDRAMGFCLINHVAIAARYVQQAHGIKRVLIIDWDVHHGNGTQAMFYDDPSVLFFSVHQYPFYPGTGHASEQGEGAGVGFTLNEPLPAGADDEAVVEAFKRTLIPAAARFRPEFVLISAGFDGHRDDPLAGWNLSAKGYATLTHLVKGIARQYAGGRLVSLLEGGYDLESLSRSVAAHIRALRE